MRKDRKLNKLILFASILGVMAGIILLAVGGAVGALGYFKPEEMLKIDDLTFFVNQKGITKFQTQIFDALLKTEFLYLFLGIIIAVVGFLVLNFAIIGINYAKKRKVVRRRLALLIFTLVPLAIVACATTYLVLEMDYLTDNIKYGAYGVIGAFGVIALFNILGVLCSRSEKFMSNDNNKYAFDNSSLRNARREVNTNVRDAQYQPNVAQNPQYSQVSQPNMQRRPVNQQGQPMRPAQPQGAMSQRPAQPINRAQMPQRPTQQGMIRQQVQNPQVRPMSNTRPQVGANPQSTARPVTSMSTSSAQSRPSMQQRPAMPRNAYCPKCGKQLRPSETICTLCGTKVVK